MTAAQKLPLTAKWLNETAESFYIKLAKGQLDTTPNGLNDEEVDAVQSVRQQLQLSENIHKSDINRFREKILLLEKELATTRVAYEGHLKDLYKVENQIEELCDKK